MHDARLPDCQQTDDANDSDYEEEKNDTDNCGCGCSCGGDDTSLAH
jgi:hypothetical protein